MSQRGQLDFSEPVCFQLTSRSLGNGKDRWASDATLWFLNTTCCCGLNRVHGWRSSAHTYCLRAYMTFGALRHIVLVCLCHRSSVKISRLVGVSMSHVDVDGSCSRSLTDSSGRGSFHVWNDQVTYCIQYKSLVLQLLAHGTKTKTYETAEIFSWFAYSHQKKDLFPPKPGTLFNV